MILNFYDIIEIENKYMNKQTSNKQTNKQTNKRFYSKWFINYNLISKSIF